MGRAARCEDLPDASAPPTVEGKSTLDEPATEKTPAAQQTPDKEALFKQVFGESPAETVHRLFAPILVDGHSRGQGMVLLPSTGKNI